MTSPAAAIARDGAGTAGRRARMAYPLTDRAPAIDVAVTPTTQRLRFAIAAGALARQDGIAGGL